MRNVWILLLMALIAFPGSSFAAGSEDDKEVQVSPLEEYLRQARASAFQQAQQGPSLFSMASSSLFLFVDVKARNVNDIVTIRIIETSTASNSANTSTSRDGDAGVSAPSFFGLEVGASALNFANILTGMSNMAFSGEGTTSRSGSLIASLSARVVEVLPNRDLVLEGVKEVTINDERHVLTLRGVVRSRDVSPGNLVLSTSIAHMEVKFDGNGIISDANKPGFFYRLFKLLTPF